MDVYLPPAGAPCIQALIRKVFETPAASADAARAAGGCAASSSSSSAMSTTSAPAPRPAVLFVTGGAWVIGYKLWGLALARALSAVGIVVILIDYRNFPQARISGMIADVQAAVSHVLQPAFITNFNIDSRHVYLAGQSAGAHLVSCTAIERALVAARNNSIGTDTSYSGNGNSHLLGNASPAATPTAAVGIRRVIAISGPYDLLLIVSMFARKGLGFGALHSLFEGDLDRYSPQTYVQRLHEALLEEQQQQQQHQNLASSERVLEAQRQDQWFNGASLHADVDIAGESFAATGIQCTGGTCDDQVKVALLPCIASPRIHLRPLIRRAASGASIDQPTNTPAAAVGAFAVAGGHPYTAHRRIHIRSMSDAGEGDFGGRRPQGLGFGGVATAASSSEDAGGTATPLVGSPAAATRSSAVVRGSAVVTPHRHSSSRFQRHPSPSALDAGVNDKGAAFAVGNDDDSRDADADVTYTTSYRRPSRTTAISRNSSTASLQQHHISNHSGVDGTGNRSTDIKRSVARSRGGSIADAASAVLARVGAAAANGIARIEERVHQGMVVEMEETACLSAIYESTVSPVAGFNNAAACSTGAGASGACGRAQLEGSVPPAQHEWQRQQQHTFSSNPLSGTRADATTNKNTGYPSLPPSRRGSLASFPSLASLSPTVASPVGGYPPPSSSSPGSTSAGGEQSVNDGGYSVVDDWAGAVQPPHAPAGIDSPAFAGRIRKLPLSTPAVAGVVTVAGEPLASSAAALALPVADDVDDALGEPSGAPASGAPPTAATAAAAVAGRGSRTRGLAAHLPAFSIFHGSRDRCVPSSAASSFAASLCGIGMASGMVECKVYEGKSHTGE